MKKPVPVILDTDIGSDLDDTWALAMALKSPEIDLKLVTVTELKNFMSNYIEIHGQNDNQQLLDSRTHIKYLDSFYI